jgi:hypothetical protein
VDVQPALRRRAAARDILLGTNPIPTRGAIVSATPFDQPVQPSSPEPAAGVASARSSLSSRAAAIAAAALLAGGGLGFVVGHETASSGSSAAAPGSAFGGARGGFAGGGVAGEQHVQGTLTGTTPSSITVKTSAGSTVTYAIQSTTQIVRNGQTAALSSLQAGDPVVVHVVPSSSGNSKLVEMVLAGTSASDGPGAFGGPPSGAARSGSAPTGRPSSGSTGTTSLN